MHTRKFWLILLLGLMLRLFRVESPILDWHAFRQADTASVTREYVKQGIDILRPKYQDLSNIQSGHDNIEGWRMVEFPIVNASLALILKVLPIDLVRLSRLASVIASIVGLYCFYKLLSRIGTHAHALWGTWWLAVLPYAIFYSRTVLPEPFMLAALIASFWQFDNWLVNRKWHHWWAGWLLLVLALLLKPIALFFIPVYLCLTLIRKEKKAWLDYRWYLFGFSVIFPLYQWREWIKQFPSGVPAFDWLLNSNGIRWRPAWFRWLFWERITVLLLGWAGIIFAVSAFLTKKFTHLHWLAFSWWLSTLLYFSIIATGNVQHDYYQFIILPGLTLTLGLGTDRVWQALRKRFSANLATEILGVGIGACLVGAWINVHGFYNLNHREYLIAGKAADQLTPADSLVIAPAMGDTQFLFQTNRRGWPIGFEIEKKIALGAKYYISTSYDDEARALSNRYTILKQTNDYILIDLTKPKNL